MGFPLHFLRQILHCCSFLLRPDAHTGIPDAQHPGWAIKISTPPVFVYFTALESSCSMTKASHLPSVSTFCMHRRVGKAQVPPDELGGEFFSRRCAEFRPVPAPAAHNRRCPSPAAGTHQHHLGVLLDALQVLRQAPGQVRIGALQLQVHGRNGDLDLVDPEGIVIHPVLIAPFQFRPVPPPVPGGVFRSWPGTAPPRKKSPPKMLHQRSRQLGQLLQRPVMLPTFAEVRRQEAKSSSPVNPAGYSTAAKGRS